MKSSQNHHWGILVSLYERVKKDNEKQINKKQNKNINSKKIKPKAIYSDIALIISFRTFTKNIHVS